MSFEREREDRERTEKRLRRAPTRMTVSSRMCPRCGHTINIAGPGASRIKYVHGLHEDRCREATPEERIEFRRTGKWPRRKKS